MRSSTKRLISMLISGILLLGTAVFIPSIIGPAVENINEKRSELRSKETFLQERTEVVEAVDRLVTQLVENLSDLQMSIDTAIPSEEDLKNIINQLDGMLARSNSSLSSVTVSEARSADLISPQTQGLGFMDMEINLSGNYSDIKDFVGLIETNLRLFEVVELSVDVDPESLVSQSGTEDDDLIVTGDPIINMSATVRSFFQNN